MSKLDELINKLCPNGVRYSDLGHSCQIRTGKLNANAMDENGLYPFFTCDANPYRINTYAFDTDAILISGNGSQVGHLNKYKGKFNAYQRTYVLDEFRNIDKDFLFHWMRAYLKPYIFERSKKGSVPYITLPMLESFRFPVPPMEVQREIVRILDNFTELTSVLTSVLTSELTARRKQYEYYRELLLSGAKDSIETKLDDVASHYTGLTYKPSDISREGKGTLVLRSSNIQNSRLAFEDNVFVELDNIPERAIAKENDLLICVRNGSRALIGKSALIPQTEKPMAFGAFMTILRPNPKNLYFRYLYHFWNSAENQKMIHGDEAMPINQITNKEFSRIILRLPSLDKQKEIADALDKFDAQTNSLTSGLPAEIEARQKQYEYYRDKLLSFKELKS